jgi:hypothetical protein
MFTTLCVASQELSAVVMAEAFADAAPLLLGVSVGCVEHFTV